MVTNSSNTNNGGPPQMKKEMEISNNKRSCDLSEKVVIHLMVGFKEICVVTAALPMLALFICFVTAYIFQSEEIHETHCRVYNVIPSISAITGVSPQRYLWRICVAIHIGPRFAIAAVYRNYYRALLKQKNLLESAVKGNKLVDIVYWLNLVEIGSLCGVTYVSNRENYPMHEKIFICFMICSLCHMLATIKLLQLIHSNGPPDDKVAVSLSYKKMLFGLSIASTIGLVLFFLKHRIWCHDMAFSWFALCEYIIATANMSFHCTTILDFPCEHFLIARGASLFQLKCLQHDEQALSPTQEEKPAAAQMNHINNHHVEQNSKMDFKID